MSELNIKLFRKIRNRIRNIPESYNQNVWGKKSRRSPCGTVACLAGEAIICAAPTVKQGLENLHDFTEQDRDDEVPNRAAELLGLQGNYYSCTPDDTDIFMGHGAGFPLPYREQFQKARTKAAQAAVVVDYLGNVIKTGRVR